MLSELLWVIALTFAPGLELRASIPYGIFVANLHWSLVLAAAIVTNVIVGTIAFLAVDKLLHVFLRMNWFAKIFEWYKSRVLRNLHTSVQRWGDLGMAVFIGIPLPGSGSYSGALAAHLIGMPFKRFFLSNLVGVIIAGVIVTIVCLFGGEAFSLFIQK